MRSKYTIAYIGTIVALTVAYILLILLPEPVQAVLRLYHLSVLADRLLLISIIVILTFTWSAGAYGSLNAKRYALVIKRSRDGKAINYISNGFLVLSMGLAVTSVLSAGVGLLIRNHASWQSSLTIINNYVDLAIMGAAFTLIARGGERLYDLVRPKIKPVPQKAWVFLTILASAVYGYFVVNQNNNNPLGHTVYFLPNWLLLISITVPYLYFWYRGLNATYCIYQYQKNIKGRLYKSALNLLAIGIFLAIISSIATRIITTVSPRLTALSLTPILFIIYGLLIVYGAGYILIAVGARRLRRIEEV